MLGKRVLDYWSVFADNLHNQLQEDEKRWGDEWRNRSRTGQESRIFARLFEYYFDHQQNNKPIPWLKVAGLAMIAWIRENYPDYYKDS